MNFCKNLCSQDILQRFIYWPSQQELSVVAHNFSDRCGFPGVVGAIDGTYIQISGPPVAHRASYICRKGFTAMHLQGVCEKSMRFLDVFCAYPGSVHDARVFRNSPLMPKLQRELPPEYHLLGDSAYSLSTYLMVPFRDNGHLTEEQKSYNEKHSSTRVEIERCFGLLKGKFRKLKYLDMKKPEDMPVVIVACCVLHNFVIDEKLEDEEVEEEENYEEGDNGGHEADDAIPDRRAVAKRQEIMLLLA